MVNPLELLQIYMHIEIKSIQLSQSVCFYLFLKNSKRLFFGKQKNYCLLSFEKK